MTFLVSTCLAVLAGSMIASLVRLLRGPTGFDRAIALDTITMLAASFLGMLAVREEEPAYLDVALVIALVSFLATVALALLVQHIQSRPGREPGEPVEEPK